MQPKAILFDLIGTCLDWHQSIYDALNAALLQTTEARGTSRPEAQEISGLALAWRQKFFDEIHTRYQANQPPEDIDVTHRRVLQRLLASQKWQRFSTMPAEHIERCVQAWHRQVAWSDVVAALPKLRERYDVAVLANGSTRLQVDITKSSGLEFDMLFSSELLDLTKPSPEIYRKAMSLLKRRPAECVMVAAHAYDLRAAKNVGMRTAYIQRWSEDVHENMTAVKAQNDWFVDARDAPPNTGGLLKIYELLGQA